jgi:hypothetical protein
MKNLYTNEILFYVIFNLSMKENKIHQKVVLRYLILVLIISSILANSIIIFSDSFNKHSSTLLVLNITAAFASSLGVIAVYRHGFHGPHGESYLFLTLGLISWFSADMTLAYYYFALGIEEQIRVSITDFLWFAGYVFLTIHVLTILRLVQGRISWISIMAVSLAATLIIGYTLIRIISSYSQFLIADDFTAFLVTLIYPMLDLILIMPSILVLVNIRKDILQFIPWFLSSLSLLVNAIADEGYVNDFVNGHLHNLLFWDMFYVTDFIIMAGALFWYNKFHILHEPSKTRLVG